MELNENLKKFFKGIGLDTNLITILSSEDANVDEAISKFQSFTKAKLAPEFESGIDERLKVEYGKSRIKFMRDINKTFELGLTSEEISDLDYKDFLSKAKGDIDDKFKGTEAEKAAKYEELTKKYEDSINKQKSEYEKRLEEATRDKHEYISRNEFLSSWSAKKLGVKDTQKEFFQKAIYKEATENFNILEGNRIVNKDGTPVMNPDQTGIWSTLDDFIDHKIEALEIGKVSGGSETASSTVATTSTSRSSEFKSSAADALLERAKSKGVVVN